MRKCRPRAGQRHTSNYPKPWLGDFMCPPKASSCCAIIELKVDVVSLNLFFPSSESHACIIQQESQNAAVSGRWALLRIFRDYQKLTGLREFGIFMPNCLKTFSICERAFSLCHWIMLWIIEYYEGEQMNLQTALENATKEEKKTNTKKWTEPNFPSTANSLVTFDCHCLFAYCCFFLLEGIWFVNLCWEMINYFTLIANSPWCLENKSASPSCSNNLLISLGKSEQN